MKKIVFIMVLMFALAALAGCNKGDAAYGADDTAISVKSGEAFTISLEANLTTGYEWTAVVGDETVLVLDKSEYVADEAAEGVVGTGGTEVFTFNALKSGKTSIEMVYQQSWEPKEDDKHLTFNVTVK